MSDRKLPPPETVGDFYLAEILDELRGLRADLQSPPPEDMDIKRVKEPAESDKSRRRNKQ